MKKAILIALVCVIAVAVLTGCGNGGSEEPENPMVGKWEVDGAPDIVYELKDDGTYESVDPQNPESRLDGTYVVEGDHLILYWGEKKCMNS